MFPYVPTCVLLQHFVLWEVLRHKLRLVRAKELPPQLGAHLARGRSGKQSSNPSPTMASPVLAWTYPGPDVDIPNPNMDTPSTHKWLIA